LNIATINDATQLADLETQIAIQRKKLENERKQRVREQIIEAAKVAGYSVPELFGAKKGKTVRQAKYRHPANSSLTWSGLGRRPLWVQSYLQDGGTLNGLAA
jgi:DNA-binding protein H-NS